MYFDFNVTAGILEITQLKGKMKIFNQVVFIAVAVFFQERTPALARQEGMMVVNSPLNKRLATTLEGRGIGVGALKKKIAP